MAGYIFCFRCCQNQGLTAGNVPLREVPTVKLDTTHMGNDVVVVKNGRRVCGTGAVLANAPIAQNKAYFEIKLQSSGVWGVGVATRKGNLNVIPLGTTADSWVLRHNGYMFHNNEEVAKVTDIPQEGDILGLTYDHVELNFYLNGKQLNSPFRGVKGTVYPLFYVDEGAIMDVQFSNFYHTPPDGFEQIMIEKSLL